MRAPRGFKSRRVRDGFLFVEDRGHGRWVILAGAPDMKLDNLHADGHPHLHPKGWTSKERRFLRRDLSLSEAERAVARQLERRGFLDASALQEELS